MSDKIRQALKTMPNEFTARDFKGMNNLSASLIKMERRGEILCIKREQGKGQCTGAPMKTYVVLKLKPFGEYTARSKEPKKPSFFVKEHPAIAVWKSVFPQWFALPAMKLKGKITNKLGWGIVDED